MTLFWIFAGLMIVVGIALVAPSLMRQRNEQSDDDTREQNISIARERLKEMEVELAESTISEETFEQAKVELEKGLMNDISGDANPTEAKGAGYGRHALIAILVLVPAIGVGVYTMIGSPQYMAMSGPGAGSNSMPEGHASMAESGKAPTMEELVVMAEKNAERNPDDPEGWYMLGKTYSSLGRFQEAADAFEKLRELTNDHPAALLSQADALAMVNGGKVSGKPLNLVLKVLDQEPENTVALWLAGKGAAEQGDLQNAIYYWRQAEAGLADDPKSLHEIQSRIARVKAEAEKEGVEIDDPGSSIVDVESLPSIMQQAPLVSTPGVSVSVSVNLSDELKAKADPDDTLFVFARQVSGPPMPLAAKRHKVKDLPLQITIDDSALIMPNAKLADFEELKLAARISKGGEPMAKSGDLQSLSVVFKPGTDNEVDLVIDQVVP